VLAQSVKENLVEDPRLWPGFHCAESLVSGEPVPGIWFDGTGYGKALHAERAKKEENRKDVRREDYVHDTTFSFDQLPALADLSPDEYKAEMATVVDEIVKAGIEERRQSGQTVLGAEAVCTQEPLTSSPVALPEWFEVRRRMIVWDSPEDEQVREYLTRYWEHQEQFRVAADRWRSIDSEDLAIFPNLCFIPGRRTRPIAQMEQSAA